MHILVIFEFTLLILSITTGSLINRFIRAFVFMSIECPTVIYPYLLQGNMSANQAIIVRSLFARLKARLLSRSALFLLLPLP